MLLSYTTPDELLFCHPLPLVGHSLENLQHLAEAVVQGLDCQACRGEVGVLPPEPEVQASLHPEFNIV